MCRLRFPVGRRSSWESTHPMSINDSPASAGHDPSWLVELQAMLLSTDGLNSFLDELAAITARALPRAVSCGVTLQPNGRARTIAASDQLAMHVDEIQYAVGEG